MIQQFEINLPAYPRGFHLISPLVLKNLPVLPQTGLLHIFLKHTSAALTLNENADPSVRRDFETVLNQIIPEDNPLYTHTLEGRDDMPAHVKSSLLGQFLMIPISKGRLNLGTWQGIYLCEFRNQGGSRAIVITITGE